MPRSLGYRHLRQGLGLSASSWSRGGYSVLLQYGRLNIPHPLDLPAQECGTNLRGFRESGKLFWRIALFGYDEYETIVTCKQLSDVLRITFTRIVLVLSQSSVVGGRIVWSKLSGMTEVATHSFTRFRVSSLSKVQGLGHAG